MAEWHCTVSGTKYGPVSLEVLRQWIAQGRVTAADLVWTEGMAAWQPAAGVPELGGVAPAPGPAPGYPQPYSAGPLPNAPGAVTSLVCGIIGVVIWCTGLIMGIVSITQSRKAKEVIRANPGRYGGEGMATAGMVLGIIALVVGAIGIIWLIVVLGAMGTALSSSSYRRFR